MDAVLARIATAGRLIGYPIWYMSSYTNNLCKFRVYGDDMTVKGQLIFTIYNSEYRKAGEPTEKCIFVETIRNFSGYKGLGQDLLTLLIHDACRIRFPILLSATPGQMEGKPPEKLYKFYESMGFRRIGALEHAGTHGESQEFRFDL